LSVITSAICLLLANLATALQPAQATTTAGTITGAVFQDYNSNGIRETSGVNGSAIDRGVGGVVVRAYDDTGALCGTATSGSNGSYTLSHTCGGSTARVEFTNLPAGYYEAPVGTNSGGPVQFVAANTNVANVNFGINHPCDYCQNAPLIAEPMWVNGKYNGSGASEAIVTVNYALNTATHPAPKQQVGTVWGLGWNRDSKKLFSSAVLRRHAGLGPGGLGAIYVTDFNSPTPTTAHLTTISNVGSISAASRDLNGSADPSYDLEAFSKVGKIGLGDMDISEDGKMLYVFNLNTKRVATVSIANYLATGNLPTSGEIGLLPAYPATTCTNGTDRPFGLSVHRGKLYAGVVCDASSAGGTAAHLNARVYAYDLAAGTWSTVLGPFLLNYERGEEGLMQAEFNPWTDSWPAGWIFYASTQGRPQALLSGITFDFDGSMILAFADRGGFQLGHNTYMVSGYGAELGYAQGELLRAHNNNGTFVLENAGTTVGGGGCGTNPQNTGIGGGEYYCEDDWGVLGGSYHAEVARGSVVMLPGSDMLMASAMNADRSSPWAGGMRRFNNRTGLFAGGFNLYVNSLYGYDSFGKSAGLGDLELLCDPAPTEIGNRIWNDANGDGVQDPSEAGIANITVRLSNAAGTVLSTTVTNAKGEYKFISTRVPGLLPNTNGYRILVNTAQAGVSGLSLTTLDAPAKNQDTTQDDSDSDAVLNGADAQITFNTGQAGASSSHYDFGFGVARATIGDRVWNDLNSNGLQDAGELGVSGAMVKLLDTNDAVLLSTVTDLNGIYSFINVAPGSYKVQFVKPSGYNFTARDAGGDAVDSDADATTGTTAVFAVVGGQINDTVDAGLQSIKANLSGRAWNDLNRNGQQDTGEPGMSGVPVSLFDSSGNLLRSTTTDATSRYLFSSLEPGSYVVRFTAPLNFGLTAANVGPDATDSDPNPITGITALIPLAPGETNSTTDAGLILMKANLSGRVWTDLNRDGQRTSNEPPVGGTTVQLLNSGGAVLQTTSTDIGGFYSFLNIDPGTYSVRFVPPTGYLGLTLANVGSDATDSDPIVATATTNAITLVAGESNTTTDAGVWVANGVIGDYVWLDLNNNGLQDAGEPGMPEADVTLYDVTGTAVRTLVTDGNGKFTFVEVPPGAYSLGFALPTSFALTKQKVGANPAIDSDPHPDTARTALFTLLPGESNLTMDAGVRHVKPQVRVFGKVNGNDANAAPGPGFVRNTVITLTYVISNTGNAPLTEITLTDSLLGDITSACPQRLLAENEQMTCTRTRPVSVGLNQHSVTVTATTPADLNALVLGEDLIFYTGN
jgi:protocatechuate 3,4-dioxygenase beta subunit